MTPQATANRATTEETAALIAQLVCQANPAECVRIARAAAETLQATIIDADGYHAPVVEAAGMVLADLGIVEMLLDERQAAIRRELKDAQGVTA